jgi:anionic cell wall polymer biosynthesis LytR-Cps2A-Psr (LCP) family protein
LETLYDVHIDYFARLNFAGFVNIIDALDGIDVYSDIAFRAHGGFQVREGWNHLDGRAALGFARERNSFFDGDIQRGRNQLALLTGIMQRVASPVLLQNFTSILAAVGDSFETNVPMSLVVSLAAYQLAVSPEWTINSFDTRGTDGWSTTFSTPWQSLSVIWLLPDSVAEAQELIRQTLQGTLNQIYIPGNVELW